jgi:hypothetical protein
LELKKISTKDEFQPSNLQSWRVNKVETRSINTKAQYPVAFSYSPKNTIRGYFDRNFQIESCTHDLLALKGKLWNGTAKLGRVRSSTAVLATAVLAVPAA